MKMLSMLVEAHLGSGSQKDEMEWGFRESQKEEKLFWLAPGRGIEVHILTSQSFLCTEGRCNVLALPEEALNQPQPHSDSENDS